MKPSTNLERLIALNAPYWAGEAEVIGTYFNSPKRTRESDLLWIARQCRKEFWDSFDENEPSLFLSPLKKMLASWDKIDNGISRHEVLEEAESLYEEFSHYVAFADAYDAIKRPSDPTITPLVLRDVRSWKENEILGKVRSDHRKAHGAIGMRACHFTEGGYCSVFAEGMKLRGRGPVDDAIGKACTLVYEDEFHHMLRGIAGLDEVGMSAAEWDLLGRLSVEQMRLRIPMRNVQFGNPVSDLRVNEIIAGRVAAVRFDYEKAGLAA